MAQKQSQEFRDIADKLLDKFPVAFGHINLDEVLFLVETEKAPKSKLATTFLVKPPFNFLSNYKFIMVFYEPNLLSLSEAQRVMLTYHELMHIDESGTKLVKHDIQDFRVLITKYGPNWDIDPNLPNILDDEEDIPTTASGSDDDDEEELPS